MKKRPLVRSGVLCMALISVVSCAFLAFTWTAPHSVYDLVQREGHVEQIVDAGATESQDSTLAARPQATTAPLSSPELQPIVTTVHLLSPGQSATVTFPVDALTQLSAGVESSSATDITYTVRAPSGTPYTPTLGGISVDRPEVGTWTAVISAATTATQPIDVVFAATAASDLHLAETARPFYVRTGETGIFEVALQDGETSLTGATLTGTLSSSTGDTSTVTLAETSPDTYTVHYPAALNGTYTLDAIATGTRRDSTAFRREASLVATSIPGGMIDLEGTDVTWNTADTNGDTLTDVLSATFAVDIPQAGTYTFAGSLGTAAQPSQFGTSHTQALAAGRTTVTLGFEREEFGQLLTADTYLLQQVQMVRDEDEIIDWREHFTNGFLVEPATFQQRVLQGTVNAATPQDMNGDGRYDQLVFTGVVTAARAGDYKLQASLADSTNQPFAFAEQGLALAEGENTVTIAFAGDAIAANGVSGPFTLADLVVKPLAPALYDHQLHLIYSFQTQPLTVTDFAQ